MSKKFAPKNPVELEPPKFDPITKKELAKYDGKHTGKSQRSQRLCYF